MASVFLSYDREDLDRARSIAVTLEKAGHSVWWDRHIRGGAQYSKEIENALKRADAVIVLWSEHSVESPWVRDEAATGRDSAKFVPVTIDGTEAPLGFRQFQTLDLSRRRGGSRSPALKELLAAVSALADQQQTGERTTQRPITSVANTRRLNWPIAALLGLALLVTVGIIAWTLVGQSSSVPIVAVSPADQSAKSEALSRDLLVKLGSLQAATSHSVQFTELRAGGAKPALVLNISESGSADHPEASVGLFDGKDNSLLWSKDFEQPSGKVADLKQQAAYTAAQVLTCALDALSPDGQRLEEQSLKLYLKGCAGYADKTAENLHLLLPIFLQLTRAEPKFAGGWAKLLLVESEFTRMRYLPESGAIVAPLPAHIAAARRLDASMPEVYLAEAALLPEMAFERRISLLELAVKEGPTDAAALTAFSENLLFVGRMNEAVVQAEKAVQADPLSPTARDNLIGALTYAGKTDVALAELARAERLWPGASSVTAARFRVHMRYGDPNEAMRLIQSGEVPTSGTPYVESFVKARVDPATANIDRAVQEARSFYDRQPTTIYHLAQVLGTFGREDELFPILLNWHYPDKVSYVVDALFRPSLRNVRRDPRMIAIAKRLGLLEYWRNSGNWPDFCFEPDLPYDCKTEANKLRA